MYVVESDPSLVLSLLCDVELLEEVSVFLFFHLNERLIETQPKKPFCWGGARGGGTRWLIR